MSKRVLSWDQFPRTDVVDVPLHEMDDAYFVEHDVHGKDAEEGYARRLAEDAELEARGEEFDRHPTDHPDAMNALTESVRREGVKKPLAVTWGETATPVIVDGNHRYLAARRAGLSSVPVTRV